MEVLDYFLLRHSILLNKFQTALPSRAMVSFRLPLQPRLGDTAHEEFPDHSGLSLQRGKASFNLLDRHLEFHGDVLRGVGVTLLRGLLLGRLDLGLEFSQEVRRDFAGFYGLCNSMQEPGLEVVH